MIFVVVTLASCGAGAEPAEARPFPANAAPISVISGGDMAMMILEDNSLWAWDWRIPNWQGSGGPVIDEVLLFPVHLADDVAYATFVSGAGYVRVSALSYDWTGHMFVLTTDGTLWALGDNTYGQLGDGTRTGRSNPVRIMDNVAAISAGARHSFALTHDGALYAWGNNDYGQLGDGTNTSRVNPVRIMDNISSVSAGVSHTLAITNGGALYAWGDNSYGQLGDGTSSSHVNPVRIMDNVAAVAAGAGHSLAITDDGVLYAWGNNTYSQLGDGTTESRNTPVHVADGIVTIYAADQSSFAITTDGALYAWGDNSKGQLGDGTTENRSIPAHILDDVVNFSSEAGRSLAITYDEKVWSWGQHMVGVLRRNERETRPAPAVIMDSGGFMPDGSSLVHRWRLTRTAYPELEHYSFPFINEQVLDLVFLSNGTLYINSRGDWYTSPDTGRLTSSLISYDVLTWELDSQGRLIITAGDDDNILEGIFEVIVSKGIDSTGTNSSLILHRDGVVYVHARRACPGCDHCN